MSYPRIAPVRRGLENAFEFNKRFAPCFPMQSAADVMQSNYITTNQILMLPLVATRHGLHL